MESEEVATTAAWGAYSVSGVLFLKNKGKLAIRTFLFSEKEETQGLGHSWR